MQSRSSRNIESTIGFVATILVIGFLISHFFDESATGKGTMVKVFLIAIISIVTLVVVAIVRKPRH